MESANISEESKSPPLKLQDAARAAWLAPVIIAGMSIIILPTIPSHSVTSIAYGAIICALILVGLCAAIWAAVVALGWGPRKYLVPASIGLVLNSFLTWAVVCTFYLGYQMKSKAHRESTSSTTQQSSVEDPNLVGDRYSSQPTR
jgi:hypothetical protein